MITQKQMALVHVARNRLGLDEETYRAVLFRHGGGAASAKDLDLEGFDGVMSYLTACGFRSDWTQRTYGNRPGMASPSQVDLIRKLWREWSDTGDEAGLDHWLEKKFGCSALRFATPQIAHKAITGLKRMVARNRKTASKGHDAA
jgi:hypothetical protein